MATTTEKGTSVKRTSSTERLEARVSRDLKKLLLEAAAVTGHSTLTSFVVYALQVSARKIIEEHKVAKLTAEESTRFVEALLAPASPNRHLQNAFKKYREARART